MQNFIDNVKRQSTEQPLVALGVAAALLQGVAKVMDANTQRSYAKTHAREVDRRIAASLK